MNEKKNLQIFRDNVDGQLKQIDILSGEVVLLDGEVALRAPNLFSWQMGQMVCQLIREGKSIRRIGDMQGMPSATVIYCWKAEYPDFKKAMTQARADRADYFMDKVVDEADDLEDKADVPVVNAKIAAYKWAAEKDNPERFGNARNTSPTQATGAVTIIVNTGITREEVIEVKAEEIEAIEVISE